MTSAATDLLAASRRLDWRYLLPDPTLGTVGFAGPAHAPLLGALRLFSPSVARIDAAGQRRPRRAYDLVVHVEPTAETLRHCAGLLRDGGALYAQISRRASAIAASRYLAELRATGLADARCYWHWPSFERCAEIVPLDDPAALLHFLTRRGGGEAGCARLALAGWLVRRRRLPDLAAHVGVVARKPGARASRSEEHEERWTA